MIVVEKLQKDIEKKEGTIHHVKKLLENLGNPSDYEFTGQVFDAGNSGAQCACTHDIRYCFIIRHKDNRKEAQVGSTCINHIASVSPELGQILLNAKDKLESELADAIKKAKRAKADAENQLLWEEYCILRDRAKAIHKANRDNYRKSHYQLWYFCESWDEKYSVKKIPDYTRAGDLKKWLIKAIERVNFVLHEGNAFNVKGLISRNGTSY